MDDTVVTLIIFTALGLVTGLALLVSRVPQSRPAQAVEPQITEPELPKTRTWWLWSLVNETDMHTIIVGRTRAGKSYLANALVTAFTLEGHRVAILDPHAKLSDWSRLPVIGRGKKYLEIENAIQQLMIEADRRFDRLGETDGESDFEPLEIFIDEARGIKNNCPSAAEFFKTSSCEWAKIGIRIHILTQLMLVKSLGLEGEGEVRENFNIIYLKSRAVKKWPAVASMARPAVIEYEDQAFAIDVTWLANFSQAYKADLQMTYKFASSEFQVPSFRLKTTENSEQELRTIQVLLQGGLSVSEVAALIGGNRQAAFQKVNAVKERIASENKVS